MIKRIVVFLLILSFSFALNGEEVRTKDDFIPPGPGEEPIFPAYFHVEPETGILLSSLGVLTGVVITLNCSNNIVQQSIDDSESIKLQQNIIGTGVGLIGTGIFAIALDFFISKIRESNKSDNRPVHSISDENRK